MSWLIVLGFALFAMATGCINPREGYEPTQPIAFSHKIHAGENDISCRYCHVSPAEGPKASIPGVNTCMNCHSKSGINGRNPVARKEIGKIRKAWENDKPIRWVKVHDMPDHVQFRHRPHILKDFECSECHGEVQNMSVVSTQNRFNMGWCIDCHRQNNAPIDCATCHY